MKRFMIGQFDKFDLKRQNRDYRNDFFGIEVNGMESLDELEQLFKYQVKKLILDSISRF